MVRTIIISGGTSGIGLAAAKILSREEIRNAAKRQKNPFREAFTFPAT